MFLKTVNRLDVSLEGPLLLKLKVRLWMSAWDHKASKVPPCSLISGCSFILHWNQWTTFNNSTDKLQGNAWRGWLLSVLRLSPSSAVCPSRALVTTSDGQRAKWNFAFPVFVVFERCFCGSQLVSDESICRRRPRRTTATWFGQLFHSSRHAAPVGVWILFVQVLWQPELVK